MIMELGKRKLLLLLMGLIVLPLLTAAGCGGSGNTGTSESLYTYALHTKGLVNVIDQATGTVIKSIDTDVDGNGTPGDVNTNGTLASLTPDGKKLYVSNANAGTNMRKVTVIDTTTLAKIKDIETGAVPKHAIVSPDGKWLGVNHWRCEPNTNKLRVSFVSTSTDTVYQNIDLTLTNACTNSNQSMHNAWSWDSKYFFTSSYADDKVYVFRAPTTDGGQFALAAEYDLSVSGATNHPHYFAPSNDNKQMWVVTEGPAGTYSMGDPTKTPLIYVIDLDSLAISVPNYTILKDGEVIEGHHGNFSLDGKYFYFLNRGPGSNLKGVTVDVFDTAGRSLVKHVVTSLSGQDEGDGHAYLSPDGKTVAITKYGTNVLTFLDPANNWAMTDVVAGDGPAGATDKHVGHITFTADSKKAFCANELRGAVYQIDLNGYPATAPVVSKKIMLVMPDLTTPAGSGAGQVINTYTNIFEVAGNLFKR